MIIGTGIDLVNMERIERAVNRWGNLFLRRVFTEKEIEWCLKRTRPSECFAIRFAAKEAFLKAIGWGLRNGIQWIDIEVENDAMGKPFHRLSESPGGFGSPSCPVFSSHTFPRASIRRGPCDIGRKGP
jgi:holo-[acyl-carrier protein] synthase